MWEKDSQGGKMEIIARRSGRVLEVGNVSENGEKTFFVRTGIRPNLLVTYAGFKGTPTINGEEITIGQTILRGERILG